MLIDLLHPFHQHEKLRQEINEMIDIPFIEQQAKNEALDFLVSYLRTYTLLMQLI